MVPLTDVSIHDSVAGRPAVRQVGVAGLNRKAVDSIVIERGEDGPILEMPAMAKGPLLKDLTGWLQG